MARPVGIVSQGDVTVRCTPAAAYTAAGPLVGDLVIFDGLANFTVNEAAANQNPDGEVTAVNDDGSLSVRMFGNPTFELLGMDAGAPPVLGQAVEGVAADQVVGVDNVNGRGFTVAINWPAAGQCVVAYGLQGGGTGA